MNDVCLRITPQDKARAKKHIAAIREALFTDTAKRESRVKEKLELLERIRKAQSIALGR
ncbi:hypothetical protein [Aestuariibacter sp. A3R04]|uniref:hypothetical protein n=1 Tax=Aestuariibacter sp. A3R04 TaxID=2841571 RepID=UPI001C08A464|nr:hypothetical protein [Aestuariibacter sp. A3R04]MBU3022867.1 hypothetical protein [Aestuariibacter sp. A3R04]